YQREGLLVRLRRDNRPKSRLLTRPPHHTWIEQVPPSILRERLAANARWQKVTDKGTKEEHPPSWSVSAVQDRGSWEGVRHLEGVVDYPVLRPDGSLLCTRGYDDDTGLYLEYRGKMPAVPDDPDKDAAIDARDSLLEVTADFPFAAEMHKSAWLA